MTKEEMDELVEQIFAQYTGLNNEVSLKDIAYYIVDKIGEILESDKCKKLQDDIARSTKHYHDRLQWHGFTEEEALQIVCFTRSIIQNSLQKK